MFAFSHQYKPKKLHLVEKWVKSSHLLFIIFSLSNWHYSSIVHWFQNFASICIFPRTAQHNSQKSKNKDGKYVRLGLDGMAGGGAPGWQIGNTIIAANITNYSGTHWPGKHAGDMFGKKNLTDKHFTCHEMTPAYLIAKAAAFSCIMPMQCVTHYTVGYMSDITLILANSQSFQH